MRDNEYIGTGFYEAHLYPSPWKSQIHGWLTAADLREIADKMDAMKEKCFCSWLSQNDKKPYIERLT